MLCRRHCRPACLFLETLCCVGRRDRAESPSRSRHAFLAKAWRAHPKSIQLLQVRQVARSSDSAPRRRVCAALATFSAASPCTSRSQGVGLCCCARSAHSWRQTRRRRTRLLAAVQRARFQVRPAPRGTPAAPLLDCIAGNHARSSWRFRNDQAHAAIQVPLEGVAPASTCGVICFNVLRRLFPPAEQARKSNSLSHMPSLCASVSSAIAAIRWAQSSGRRCTHNACV